MCIYIDIFQIERTLPLFVFNSITRWCCSLKAGVLCKYNLGRSSIKLSSGHAWNQISSNSSTRAFGSYVISNSALSSPNFVEVVYWMCPSFIFCSITHHTLKYFSSNLFTPTPLPSSISFEFERTSFSGLINNPWWNIVEFMDPTLIQYEVFIVTACSKPLSSCQQCQVLK